MPFCFLVQNFAKIGQLVDELWPKKTIFKMAAAAILNFKNFNFWSRDCHRVQYLMQYTKFQQNRTICVKIRPGPLAVASCKNPKKTEKLTLFWCAKSRMRGDETPGRIVTNFCTGVGVQDVITCADLYYDHLRGLGVVGG